MRILFQVSCINLPAYGITNGAESKAPNFMAK